MRFVFLDEAGTADEPCVVTAGVIVHADKQLRLAEQRLRDLAVKYLLAEDRVKDTLI